MYNYKLVIEYDGINFNGWQKQKNTKNTIQEQIETAGEKILREKISLIGAGRTDSGVSAYNQVANFKFPKKIDLKKFKYSLNSLLASSITIKKISLVKDNFHSRYSANKREYIYKITTVRKSIGRNEFFRIGYDLDFKNIDRFIKLIKKQTYFKSFCKNREDKNNFLCKIFDFRYKKIKSRNEIIFSITANRFLHSMVRAIIGCALDTGRGKINFKTLEQKIKRGDKTAIQYLPAHALFLNKIYY